MADKDFGVRGLNLIGQTGTPTIISPNNLNINAITVAISTDLSIGGKVASNLVLSNSYSVGIGTTVLTERLNVSGNANISGIVSATRFVGSGVSLTGVLTNQSSAINTGEYQYLLVTPQTSGTISSVSSSYNYIIFNPTAKYLGIGTDTPEAGLDVNGTGRFTGNVIAPTFQGTATTATNLADAANITTGIVSTARLSGTYNISISGNVATATTASNLTSTASVNTSGIITATGGFVGNLTGTATTASGLTTTANVNTSGIITASKFVGNVEGTIVGIASTAIQLQNTRYFSISGDVSTGSSVAFNGTQNVGLAVTLALSGVTPATYGSSTSIPSISVNSKGIITGVTTSGITVGNGTLDLNTSGTGLSGIATFTANQATGTAVTFTVTSNATHLNTASAIVARDASGNFRAGIITATTFSGTATTANNVSSTININTSGIITSSTFSTGISTQNIGITTGIISGPNTIYINPHQIGVSTGTVRIVGNLIVEGSTTTEAQATIQTSAKTIGVAVSFTDPVLLDGAGIGIGSTSIQKTLLWNYGSSSLKSSENFNLANGKVYQINDNAVLSSTTLANSVTTAAGITTVGTLQQLIVSSNTSSNAVRITQIGSGNALTVEDEASPDGTAFIVSANGSIGIGTTIPEYKLTITNNALPTYNLTHAIADFTGSVDGYTQLNIRNSLAAASASADLIATADTGSDTTNFIDLGINNSAFSSGSWTVNGALDGYLYTSDGSLSIGIGTTNTAKYLSFFAGGFLAANEQVRINQTGVGIGTINPTSKLTVAGDVRITGVSTLGVTTATNLTSQQLNVSGIATVGFITATSAYVGVATVGFLTATNIRVSGVTTTTRLNVGTGGTIITTTTDGLVGIGITNPVLAVDIFAPSNSNGILRVKSQFGSAETAIGDNFIKFNYTGGSTIDFADSLVFRNTSFNNILYLNANTKNVLINNIIATGTANQFLQVSGGAAFYGTGSNVGIGTTAPTSTLHVQGNAYITGVTTSTDFDSLSDFNLKTNIHQIEDSLSKVIQIRGVTFNWKDTNRGSAGVIAQEVEKVLPELVSGEETKTVNYNGVIGALVEAVKELKAENDVLKERLDEVYKKVFW